MNQRAVMLVMNGAGPEGLTDEQLVVQYNAARGGVHKRNYPKQSGSGLRSRRSELVEKGYVVDTRRKERISTGNLAIVWRATTSQERQPFSYEREVKPVDEGGLFDGDEGAVKRLGMMDVD